jgi:hypothetical protein
MPAQVDGNAAEVLFVAAQRAHFLGAQAEVLWGTPAAVVPTQEAALHGSQAEVLVTATSRALLLGSQTEALWLDLTFLMVQTGAQAEVLWGTPAAVPTQEAAQFGSASEVLYTASDEFLFLASQTEVMVTYDVAVAAVADISGPPVTPATFDGTTSLGFISSYAWNWVSVPVGSLVGNSILPYPDLGATNPIDMTGNAVLYHAEETVGSTGADTSGSGNTANLTAITVGQPGRVGSYAWQFTGGTSRVQPTVPVAIPGDYTIAFWFKGLAPNGFWRTGARGVSSWHHIIVETGGTRLGLYSGGFRATNTNYSMPAASFTGWHQLVSVGTGGDTEFYIDGAHVGTVVGYKSTDSIRTLGNYQGNPQRFADFIDELAIWNRALSSTEIAGIFTVQSGNFAGFGSMFTFTPDEDGTYTINLTVVDGVSGAQTVDTADAVIGAGGGLLFPLQGDSIRMWGHLQGRGLRKRGQK